MNTPPRSPSPPSSSSSSSTIKKQGGGNPAIEPGPSKDDGSGTTPSAVQVMASPPSEPSHAGPDPDTTLPSSAEDVTVRVDNASCAGVLVDLDDVYLDGEHDQEPASAHSSSSEEVEIYLNDLGLDTSVDSGTSGRVFGIQITGMFAVQSSPTSFLLLCLCSSLILSYHSGYLV